MAFLCDVHMTEVYVRRILINGYEHVSIVLMRATAIIDFGSHFPNVRIRNIMKRLHLEWKLGSLLW